MTDADTILDELNGRLTSVTVKYPEAKPFIQSFQKHVVFALNNPKERRMGKLLKKGREWLNTMAWKHPIFREDFMPMVKAIDDFQQQHGE